MKYADRLVAMLAPNVIGHNDAKLGLLRSLVGGRTDHGDDNGRRGRINSLLVGDPGTAKSILARESTKQIPNSRYVNAQNTSGKSLIGIVDKENDGLFLRLGPAVLAKGAVCAINEIGFMSPEDQGHLTPFELDAPTTIIATANPYNTEWNNASNISKNEIPILRTLVDRKDQVYAFRDSPSEQELRDYVKQKTKIRKRKPHNYNFLRKLLIYARTINPEITKYTEFRLNVFWTNARIKDVATNRTYDSVFRIAEAQARLNLSNEIDDDIATQTMDSVGLMLLQYGKIVETVKSPRDITYNAFLNILKQSKAPLSVEELCKVACEESKQISEYLGDKFKMRDNIKVRVLIEMLLQHSLIKQIQQNPIVLQWFNEDDSNSSPSTSTSTGVKKDDEDKLGDACDACDPIDKKSNEDNKEKSQTGSHISPISHNSIPVYTRSKRSLQQSESGVGKFRCFYCSNQAPCFSNDIERIEHIDIEHPGRLHYPTPEDFANRLER